MKKLLAVVGLFAGVALATASIAPQPIPTRPYENLNVPPEATAAAAGGLGVVATDQVKSTVVMKTGPGGPCGKNYSSEPVPDGGSSGPASGDTGLWLSVGVGAGVVAGIGIVGFVLLRRLRV